jgi:SAM-dependent methyltransferase
MDSAHISDYYESLAPDYDRDRFGNSYGQFIHAQETSILRQLTAAAPAERALDLACGTGRLLDFADTGLDSSPAMLAEAQQKHPDKALVCADALALPFGPGRFDRVHSFHFLMHLRHEQAQQVLREVERVLRPGGHFIFDFPSAHRRSLLPKSSKNSWHAASAWCLSDWAQMAGEQWRVTAVRAYLFLPIHRFPPWLRPLLRHLDALFCRSFLKEYASYLVLCLQKK